MPKPKRKKTQLVIGVDLGGTNMQIGVVDAAGRIVGSERRKTIARDGAAAVIDRMAEGIHLACQSAGETLRQIAAVGVAAPGAIDIPRGVVLEAPNLRWYGVKLRDMLRAKLRRPVIVDNDVNGAVWGEYQTWIRLSNPPARDVLGVWLGTGVGGGLVLDGKLFHGTFYTAGEIGHAVLFPDGKKGRRTVEDFCSRTGMSRTIRLKLNQFPKSILRDADDGSGNFGSLELARAFRQGDRLASQVIHEAAHLLGVAIANWITVLSLNTVVIGGGVTEALGPPFLKLVRQSFQASVFPKRCAKAKLIMTRLRDNAGLLGAAALAREIV